jgi:S1-C subfamily serine protease
MPNWGSPEERSLLNVERGVVVVSRVPGFCAYRMLQDGDVLLSMANGAGSTIEFASNDQLVDAVRSAKAGDTVQFEVLRQGQILTIPITLDRKPMSLQVQLQIEEFNGRRADQVNDLWDRDFAPLLVETLG